MIAVGDEAQAGGSKFQQLQRGPELAGDNGRASIRRGGAAALEIKMKALMSLRQNVSTSRNDSVQ